METFKRSYHLLCPGPVNVRSEVANALTSYEFCHREREFSLLLESLERNILAAAELRDPESFTAVVITGSGTAANETVISSVVDEHESLLILSNGEFGERLARTATIYHGERAELLEHPWGSPLRLERLEARLAQGGVGWVAMTHHETSTGMLNPVQAVGALCHRYGAQLFVDAVSSFTADPLDLEASHISFMSSSSGKAISCYPGLSIVIGRNASFEGLAGRKPRTQYLDLYRYFDFARSRSQTPNTPGLPLFLALNEAFSLALEEGMQARFERMRESMQYVRRAGMRLGLKPLLEDASMCSSAVTSFVVPERLTFEQLQVRMRAGGFVIYGGKGPLQNKIFQISTLGEVSHDLIDAFFDHFATTLAALRVSEAA